MEISAIGKLLSAAVSVGTGLRASKRNFCSRDEDRSIEIQSAICRDKRLHRQPCHFGHLRKVPTSGPLLNAQRLAADNRLVLSSSPPEPTTQSRANRDFPVHCE